MRAILSLILEEGANYNYVVFREQQLPIFNEFYMKMNAEEMMWVIRIILKRMLYIPCILANPHVHASMHQNRKEVKKKSEEKKIGC